MLCLKVLGLDHLFPFFRVLYVDLVQSLQGVFKWTFVNKVVQYWITLVTMDFQTLLGQWEFLLGGLKQILIVK